VAALEVVAEEVAAADVEHPEGAVLEVAGAVASVEAGVVLEEAVEVIVVVSEAVELLAAEVDSVVEDNLSGVVLILFVNICI